MPPPSFPSPGVARLRVRALGHVVDLGVLDGALPRLEAQWSRCLAESDAPADVEIDLGRTDSPAYDYAATTQITISAVDLVGSDRLNLHAAGVAGPDGRVLTLVAASGTGKTTACAHLARDLGYVTDECVSVGLEAHDVLLFPKPLSVRAPRADDANHKEQCGPDELGLAIADAPLRLGPLVLLDRDPDVGAPRLTEVDLPTALLELIPQTSGLPRLDHPLLALTEAIQAAGGAHRLEYAEIEDAAPLCHALLGRPRPATPAGPRVAHLPGPGALAPCAGDGAGPVHRLPWTDAVRIDDEVLVLVGAQPFLLGPLGAVLWEAADAADLEALHTRAVDVLGKHADATALAASAIDALVENGLLSLDGPRAGR